MPRQSRLLSLLLLAVFAVPLAAQAGPAYTVAPVTEVGSSGSPYGINNAGQVSGYAYTPGGHIYPYVSRNGTAESRHPADPDVRDSVATGVNNSGVAAGSVTYQSKGTRAAIFADGSVQVLGTLGGSYSSAYGINAGG